jgi:type IV pilus assembly protein PilW
MVALVISSLLMAGVLTIMSSSKRTYALQSELSELQENARFVMEELAYKTRMAGYQGCDSNQNLNLGPPFRSTLNGTSVNNRPLVDEGGGAVPGFGATDALVVGSLSEQLVVDASTQFTPSTTQIITLQSRSLVPDLNTQIIVSDCGGAEENTVTARNLDIPNITVDQFSRLFHQPVELFMVTSPISYEIKKITENDRFALFRCENRDKDANFCDGDADDFEERLIEGVENMQVRYGIDIAPRDGIPNRYSSTPNIGANDKVVSVRITLLMRTNNKRGDLEGATDRDFQLDPGLTYNPQQDNAALESGYRHRVFTSTIKVRN